MPRKVKDDFDIYAEDYGEDELETLLEVLDEFPELGEYLEDIVDSLDDEDFYTTTVN